MTECSDIRSDGGNASAALASRVNLFVRSASEKYGYDVIRAVELLWDGTQLNEAKIVCRTPRDAFKLADLLLSQNGVTLVSKSLCLPGRETAPEPFSMHLVIKLPVALDGQKYSALFGVWFVDTVTNS